MLEGHSPVLELIHVHKRYDGETPTIALADVSFKLNPGDFAALVGPSGSGKSTLLNIASGLDSADKGDVKIRSQSISRMNLKSLCLFRQRHIGFVFQAYNLFPALNALENVEYTCVIRGDLRTECRERAWHALKVVGLEHKAKAFPNQLSGGQQQRVAVARALASNPDIIFADEPTANLDSETAGRLIELFQDINQTHKTTFLFSTHDHLLLKSIQNQFHMRDGKITNGH